MDPRNYHAEIMQAFAAGDAIRLATLASELASELAAVTSLVGKLQVRRQHEAERQKKRYAQTHPHVRSRDITCDNVRGSPPLDGPPFSSPDPTKSLPLIPSTPSNVASGDATAAPSGANRRPHNDYPEDFEAWWGDYPSDGRGTKTTACKAWKARKRDGHTREIIGAGLTRYKAFLAATGRYPKNASTFLGPDLHFLEPWIVPPTLTLTGRAKPTLAEDEKLKFTRIQSQIDARKQEYDGEEWWTKMLLDAEAKGARNHKEKMLYAIEHLEETAA